MENNEVITSGYTTVEQCPISGELFIVLPDTVEGINLSRWKKVEWQVQEGGVGVVLREAKDSTLEWKTDSECDTIDR